MQSKIDWLELALAALAEAQADEVHVDSHIEQFFHAITRQARGSKTERDALPSELAAAKKIAPAFRPLIESAVAAIALWSTGDCRAAERAFGALAKLVLKSSLASYVRQAIMVHALSWQAACATREGRLSPATKLLDRSEKVLASHSWPNCRGWLHAERGRLAFWHDRISDSLEEYTRASEAFQRANNCFALANVSEGQARVLIHCGRFDQAQQLLLQSDLWRSDDDTLGKVKRRYHAARILRYQERWREAIDQLTDALALVRSIDNRRWEAHIRDVLGDVYLLLGDIASAGRQFKAPVFRGDDPIVAARNRYRLTKLALAEAEQETSGLRRTRKLELVLRECLLLSAGRSEQSLREKAERLQGFALAAQNRYEPAAECLENAACRFSEHASRWYISDCLLRAGEFRDKVGQLDRAANNFLAALRTAVGPTQGACVLESLRQTFARADSQRVCELLAELFDQCQRLQEERDHWRMAYASFQELMWDSAARLQGLGAIPHLNSARKNLAALLEDRSLPDALRASLERDVQRDLEQSCGHLKELAALQYAAAQAGAPRVTAWSWYDLTDVRHALPPAIPWLADSELLRQWGVHAPQGFLSAALAPLLEFAALRPGFHCASVHLDCTAPLLTIEIQFNGESLPADGGLFRGLPWSGELAAWRLTPEDWSRLHAAARLVRSIGGAVNWSICAPHRSNRLSVSRRLLVELPVAAQTG